MNKEKSFILWFKDIGIKDVPLVGGKNAALGEMIANLVPLGINVPDGFAVTSFAYNHFLEKSGLKEKIAKVLEGLDTSNMRNLSKKGQAIRKLILKGKIPPDLAEEISKAYTNLEKLYGKNVDTAVRSSATAEDLPGASFAGQQETYLNVFGVDEILLAVRKCFASLFTDRAISYRQDKGFSHFDISLSVGIQKMARSDLASSGVAFSIDTETGFENAIIINSIYGLGELIVQGKVIPDEFIVFKPLLGKSANPIISKNLGKKNEKLVYSGKGIKSMKVPEAGIRKYSLTDNEILKLAGWILQIEEHFSKVHGHLQPMDIEWAKDGKTGELFIIQARPETVISTRDKNIYKEYRLKKTGKILLSGIAVGSKIATGKVRMIKDVKNIEEFKKGEVLVTEITDPDWEPIMKIASAIVTDKGGRTSHAAIVSRELEIPAIVGTEIATKTFKDGDIITVDCSSGGSGLIYEGSLPFEVLEHHLDKIPKTKTKIMVNIGSPDEAFKNHILPVSGVGLGRLEFIIASHIRMHPNALINYEKYKNSENADLRLLAKKIDSLTAGYEDKKKFYIDEVAEGIAKIAAAFWPNEVIIRFSDFKTNEYRKLLGGELYEPSEENPMIGWRGASRYYHPDFKEAFGLECLAFKKVREEIGLKNVVALIPFCRTVEEGKKVLESMASYGLDKNADKTLKVYLMCEIPSNVILANEFLDLFDGFSIGSNDLTQLVLGLDRDSSIVDEISNENDPAVKKMIKDVIKIAKAKNKYIGICGQAPSDFPDFADFLVEEGIVSISLNPDTVIKTLSSIAEKERTILGNL
ncbi:MAG: phosphoenolpyruvate synthase [Patescibacteria group bacterium]